MCVVPKNINCQVGAQNFHEHRIPSVCMIPKTLGTYCVHAPYEQNIEYLLYEQFMCPYEHRVPGVCMFPIDIKGLLGACLCKHHVTSLLSLMTLSHR